MDPLTILGQSFSLGTLAWGAYLCLVKRERRVGERRKSARMGSAGRRQADAMATNEGRGLFTSQRRELAALALKYHIA